jgi:hypothetical protein
MTKAKVVFGACLIIWALILFLGLDLYSGVVAQRVAGYPKPEQFYICILFPCVLLILNVLLIFFSRKLHWLVLVATSLIQFLAFFTFFFVVSGGV